MKPPCWRASRVLLPNEMSSRIFHWQHNTLQFSHYCCSISFHHFSHLFIGNRVICNGVIRVTFAFKNERSFHSARPRKERNSSRVSWIRLKCALFTTKHRLVLFIISLKIDLLKYKGRIGNWLFSFILVDSRRAVNKEIVYLVNWEDRSVTWHTELDIVDLLYIKNHQQSIVIRKIMNRSIKIITSIY